jgi:preprotein translocase subunit SecG
LLEDLLILIKHDLGGILRVKNVKGKRSERRSAFRRLFRYVAAAILAVVILWGIIFMVQLLGWSFFQTAIIAGIDFGATIFNFLVIISFMGSIAVSVATVANSSKMEYLMCMPISLRTLFLEKTIVVVFYNSLIYLIIGTPIIIGLAISSTAPYALLSIPIFLAMLLGNVTLGVALGGLIGLAISRLLAGRRRLKQIGWFLGTTVAILFSTLYYYSLYASDSGFSQIFVVLLDFARQIGLSSDFSPGGAMNAVTIRLIVGLPIHLADILLAVLFFLVSIMLIYVNAYASETAHYSGWLASGSKRSSKKEVKIAHTEWNPSDIPLLKLNTTVSVSMWYNTTSVRREGRVLANYLVGPLRTVFWFFLIFFAPGGAMAPFAPFIIISAMIPFAVSYGVYFAGYELVYEGKNLMNLQLAPASLTDYVKGKVFSAVPFTIIATAIASIIVLFVQPSLWLYIPAVVVSSAFLTLASGGIASYSAATKGDFKAQRNIARQKGAAVQMPIRGAWAMARAQLLPNLIGFAGIGAILGLGIFFNPLYSYLAMPLFALLCVQIMRSYIGKSGRKLQTIEASEYL